MNHNKLLQFCWQGIAIICGLLLLNGVGIAEHKQKTSSSPTPRKIIYRPPNLGTAQDTEAGATRGIIGTRGIMLPISTTTSLQVLAPQKYVGWTSRSQPRLYWYVKPKASHKQRITISSYSSNRTILEQDLPVQELNGIRFVDLAQYGVKLISGETYEWKITELPFGDYAKVTSSKEDFSSGYIKFIDPGTQYADNLQATDKKADIYFWYDTIDEVSRLIQNDVDKTHWLQERAALLEQINLQAVAELR